MKQRALMVLIATMICIAISTPFLALASEVLIGRGEWRSVSGAGIGGVWTASLVREGGQLSGTLDLSGSNVFRSCEVLGQIDATSIVIGAVAEGERQAVFTGKLDGETVKGEWESALVEDEGVWYGTFTND